MFQANPILNIDSYKLGHMTQYPEGTEEVYCNLTARNFEHIRHQFPDGFFPNKAVVFGLQSVIRELHENFEENFFYRKIEDILNEVKETIIPFIGCGDINKILGNIEALHELQYLPLQFNALPEGTEVGPNVPMMTWWNTEPEFAWLPNFLETYLSAQSWKLSTAATIAKAYRRIFDHFAELTGVPSEFVDFQGHDFSSRGMSGIVDATRTASGHLTSFKGTDAISSIPWVNYYYNQGKECDLVGASVPATEHSVMCLGSKDGELQTYSDLLDKFPTGIISIVSDTWDYWNVLTDTLPKLKDKIMARQPDAMGFCKTVIRPDSGDPADIICGLHGSERYTGSNIPAFKGSIQVLDETFGSTTNEKGFKTLDPHIGLIYGDAITPVRAYDILSRLMKKGYSSANVVLGIGSFTYQYVTRDSLGFAIKATHGVINGVGVDVFKDPATGSGKKSAKGYLSVMMDGEGNYVLEDECLEKSRDYDFLKVIYQDGTFHNSQKLSIIRERLSNA